MTKLTFRCENPQCDGDHDWCDVSTHVLQLHPDQTPEPYVIVSFAAGAGFGCRPPEARKMAEALIAMAEQAESTGQARQ